MIDLSWITFGDHPQNFTELKVWAVSNLEAVYGTNRRKLHRCPIQKVTTPINQKFGSLLVPQNCAA
jgi:hypothetical protein